MRENFYTALLAIEVFGCFTLGVSSSFSAGVLTIWWLPLSEKQQANAPSITRFLLSLPSLTESSPVSFNDHYCPVSLSSTIRLD